MDPRKILGVDANASTEEIQKAYRAQVRKHHPDMGGDAWAFQQVQDAYESLTNPKPAKTSNPPTAKSKPKTNPQAANSGSRPRSNANAKTQKSNKTNPAQQPSPRATRKPANAARDRTAKNSSNTQTRQSEKKTPVGLASFFTRELPLQSETGVFILANCLDIMLTVTLLNRGASEANPIAAYFINNWGTYGAIGFKLAIVAIVCVIAQVVAVKKFRTAQALLIFGTIVVGMVVIHSVNLYLKHYL